RRQANTRTTTSANQLSRYESVARWCRGAGIRAWGGTVPVPPHAAVGPDPRVGRQVMDVPPHPGLPQLDQSETPCCDSHATGLIFCPPFCQISKCRCGPVDWPRLPIVAICCPAFTCWPGVTN